MPVDEDENARNDDDPPVDADEDSPNNAASDDDGNDDANMDEDDNGVQDDDLDMPSDDEEEEQSDLTQLIRQWENDHPTNGYDPEPIIKKYASSCTQINS
jgi:hypothetical protein